MRGFGSRAECRFFALGLDQGMSIVDYSRVVFYTRFTRCDVALFNAIYIHNGYARLGRLAPSNCSAKQYLY